MMGYGRLRESFELEDALPRSTDVTWAPVSRLTQTIKYLRPWWPEYQRFWRDLGEYGLYTSDADRMWLFKHPLGDWRLLIYVLHDEVRFLYTTNTGIRHFAKETVKVGWLTSEAIGDVLPSCYLIPWSLLLQVFVYARWAACGYNPETHLAIYDIFKHFQRTLHNFTPIENLNG